MYILRRPCNVVQKPGKIINVWGNKLRKHNIDSSAQRDRKASAWPHNPYEFLKDFAGEYVAGSRVPEQ